MLRHSEREMLASTDLTAQSNFSDAFQWLLAQPRGHSVLSNGSETMLYWKNIRMVFNEGDSLISAGISIRRSSFGAAVRRTSNVDRSVTILNKIPQGSVLYQIDGIVVLFEQLETIQLIISRSSAPMCLRFIHRKRFFDAVFWESSMGIDWICPANLVQVATIKSNSTAWQNGVRIGDVMFYAENDVFELFALDKLLGMTNTTRELCVAGPRELYTADHFVPLSSTEQQLLTVGAENGDAFAIRYSSVLRVDIDDNLPTQTPRYRHFLPRLEGDLKRVELFKYWEHTQAVETVLRSLDTAVVDVNTITSTEQEKSSASEDIRCLLLQVR